MHLAEHRAVWPGKVLVQTDGAAVLVNGQRQWVSFDDEPANDDDFEEIGFAFDSICPLITGVVGAATAQWFSMVHAVDFAVDWMTQNLGLR